MTSNEQNGWEEEFYEKFLLKSPFGQCISDIDGNANERIKRFIHEVLDYQKYSLRKEWAGKVREYFHSQCQVNIYDECKYWNRDEHNESSADDKFFPEEIKKAVLTIIEPDSTK